VGDLALDEVGHDRRAVLLAIAGFDPLNAPHEDESRDHERAAGEQRVRDPAATDPPPGRGARQPGDEEGGSEPRSFLAAQVVGGQHGADRKPRSDTDGHRPEQPAADECRDVREEHQDARQQDQAQRSVDHLPGDA
jgi:hypothetical protein